MAAILVFFCFLAKLALLEFKTIFKLERDQKGQFAIKQEYTKIAATRKHVYLTIIPRAHVRYEMVDSQRELTIITSYPTSTSGIIVLLKTPVNCG